MLFYQCATSTSVSTVETLLLQENPAVQKRFAVLTSQLNKAEARRKTYEVATEKLLQFAEVTPVPTRLVSFALIEATRVLAENASVLLAARSQRNNGSGRFPSTKVRSELIVEATQHAPTGKISTRVDVPVYTIAKGPIPGPPPVHTDTD